MADQCAPISENGTVAARERQGGGNHDQAGCLVQDDGFEAAEAEQVDKQWQAKLGSSEADQSAECSDDGTAAECSDGVAARDGGQGF